MAFEQKEELINRLADVAKVKSHINKELYTKYNVKRGLRNNDGTGVLVGLTEVGEVMSYIVDDADRIPVEGKLFYQGYEVKDLVNGFFSEGRYGYEETAFLLLTGELPTASELEEFNALLQSVRPLPEGFTEDMIMKAPSPDVMNKLARSILALYSYDDNPDSTDIANVVRQCTELIARFPVLISYGYMARRHYIEHRDLYIHAPVPEYNTAQNILHMIRPDGKYHLLICAFLNQPSDSSVYTTNFDEEDIQGKQAYIDNVIETADYVTDEKMSVDDTLVVLSTCAYEFQNARYVVVCRMTPWK